ncbi:MAG: 3-hydroxybutyryl-CoA dehydrogenase [Pseudomonadota bacterium]
MGIGVSLETIAAAGAGRMGRGLAVVFALAGHRVLLVDLKARDDASAYLAAAGDEVRSTLKMLVACGMIGAGDVDRVAARVEYVAATDAASALATADVIFEGVPEVLDAKRAAFQTIGATARPDAIVASTTSTILADELQGMVAHPARFLNAHWLNPAFLVPLVELSPGAETDPAVTDRLKALLEGISKVPVVMKASPGFIVPRIQALAMNEAARIYEEGIASAEDIDKATKYGLGFRFAILGVLEFIDWGGGDILHHASRYMADATGEDRFEAPEIIGRNMAEGRIGLRTGAGFLDYNGMDVPAYQRERLAAFVAMLKHLGMLPEAR